MTPEAHAARHDSFRRLDESLKAKYPNRDFRSIGDELSSHDAVMFVAGVKAAGKPGTQTPATPTP